MHTGIITNVNIHVLHFKRQIVHAFTNAVMNAPIVMDTKDRNIKKLSLVILQATSRSHLHC